MKKISTNLVQALVVCAALLSWSNLQAQSVFWSENFSDGTPAGWSSEDVSGNGGEWTWCDDPEQSAGDGCVSFWDLYVDQHGDFTSTSASDGFMVMDSDVLQALPSNHIVQLTTDAIDCSAQTEVFVKFESLLGVFDNPTLGFAFLNVSTDGTNWTSYDTYDILPGNQGNEPGEIRWTENGQVAVIDISAQAGGESTVYLQWSWEGNYEYYWLLDDVELYDADPASIFFPSFDMSVNSNFFAVMLNAQTPASQIEEFGFLADIENVGLEDADNVNLNVNILDNTGAEVFDTDLFYGMITADSLAENQLIDATFTPPGGAGSSYTATYSVTFDGTDENNANDMQSFEFEISDTTFAKDRGVTRAIIPAASNWDDTEEYSWAYGNVFYVPNGDGYFARTITFGVSNADEIVDRILNIRFYEWDDADASGAAETEEERILLGTANYLVQGTEAIDDLITLPLNDPTNITQFANIPLENGKYYVAMIESKTNNQVATGLAATDEYDYSAMIFRTGELGDPRYADMIAVDANFESDTWDVNGFGNDVVPVVRFSIGTEPITEMVNTEDPLAAANKIELTPNPASDFLTLNVDLVNMQDNVQIRIMDVAGRVIMEQNYDNVQLNSYDIDLSRMAAGSYFLNFITEEGNRTERFVITK